MMTPLKMIMGNMKKKVNGMRKSFHFVALVIVSEGMRVILMTLCIKNMYVPNHREPLL